MTTVLSFKQLLVGCFEIVGLCGAAGGVVFRVEV